MTPDPVHRADLPAGRLGPLVADPSAVGEVVSFYDGLCEVVGAAAQDLRAHRFGGWAWTWPGIASSTDPSTMPTALADDLDELAAGASAISGAFRRGLRILAEADAEAAESVVAQQVSSDHASDHQSGSDSDVGLTL